MAIRALRHYEDGPVPMKQTSLRAQITRVLVIVYAVSVVLFGYSTFLLERDRYRDAIEGAGVTLEAIMDHSANQLGNQLFFRNSSAIALMIDRMLGFNGLRAVEVFDAEWRLFSASYDWETDGAFVAVRPESFLEAGHPVISRTSFDGRPVLAYTTPLLVVGERYGYATAYLDISHLMEHVRVSAVLLSIMIMTLFTASVLIIARRLFVLVTRPLGIIVGGMKRVTEGARGVQVHLAARSEIATIADVFNRMSMEHATMYRRLEEVNRSLEEQVADRTRELTRSRELLERVLDSSGDGIMVLRSVRDDGGTIVDFEWILANPVAAAMFGGPDQQLIGTRFAGGRNVAMQTELHERFRAVSEIGEPLDAEVYTDSKALRGWFHVTAVRIDQSIAVTFRDITQRKLRELDLTGRANQDGLTGIPNRAYFDQCLDREWTEGRETGLPVSLLFVDIDNFKAYNDTHGHVAGDERLKAVAVVLSDAAYRPRDLACRFGGDEFVVLLPRTDTGGAVGVAERVASKLKDTPDGDRLHGTITVSIGISTYVPSPGQSPRALVDAADRALYAAKQNGRDRYAVTS